MLFLLASGQNQKASVWLVCTNPASRHGLWKLSRDLPWFNSSTAKPCAQVLLSSWDMVFELQKSSWGSFKFSGIRKPSLLGNRNPNSKGKVCYHRRKMSWFNRQDKTRQDKARKTFYEAKSLKRFIWGESKWILLWKVKVLSYIYFFLINKTQTK